MFLASLESVIIPLYSKPYSPAKRDIVKGRSRVQRTGWIREPYEFEKESAYWGM